MEWVCFKLWPKVAAMHRAVGGVEVVAPNWVIAWSGSSNATQVHSLLITQLLLPSTLSNILPTHSHNPDTSLVIMSFVLPTKYLIGVMGPNICSPGETSWVFSLKGWQCIILEYERANIYRSWWWQIGGRMREQGDNQIKVEEGKPHLGEEVGWKQGHCH